MYRQTSTFGGVTSFDVPLPLVEDGYNKWEVEEVLTTRVVKKTRRKEVLILWRGFGIESSSWEQFLLLSLFQVKRTTDLSKKRTKTNILPFHPSGV